VFKRFQKESIDASLTVISQTASVMVETATPSSRSKNTNQQTETFYFNTFKIFIGKSEEKLSLGRTCCERERIVAVKFV
jgi:hypothetical protein